VIEEYGEQGFSQGDYGRALYEAIDYGRAHAVRAMLDLNLLKDLTPHAGAYMAKAAQHDTTEIIDLLLQHGVSIHAEHDSALRSASSSENISMVDHLITAGADPTVEEWQCYTDAAKFNSRCDTLALLLQAAVPPQNILNGILLIAIDRSDNRMVEMILPYKPNLNVMDNKPLRKAIHRDNLHMVKLLIDAGATPVLYPRSQQEHEAGNSFIYFGNRQAEFNQEIADLMNPSGHLSSPVPPRRRPALN
jgi:ankyrin repeat protein